MGHEVVKAGMLRILRVRDIMTRNVFTIGASTSVEDAARSLTFHHIGGAPVLEHGRIVGVVSRTDLVEPRNRPTPGIELEIRHVMTHVIYAVREGDPAMAAIQLMAKESIHRVVVLDERARVAGIVSALDVVRALAEGKKFDEFASSADDAERHADPSRAVEYVDLRTLEVAEG